MRKPFPKDLFSFSASERRGIIILVLIIILSASFPFYWPLIHHQKQMDYSAFKKEVAVFEALKDSTPGADNINNIIKPDSLFSFDPNILSAKGWGRLGLSDHLILTIQHYLAKGGHFYQPEDLKKIYGFSGQDYQILAPYIKINKQRTVYQNNQHKDNHEHYHPHVAAHSIAINRADSATLIKLSGIGPVFSARIIHFRKALGGFYSIKQLKEVYGLPDSTYNHIKQAFTIDTTLIKRLNINKVSFKTLLHHPYVNYNLTRAIFNYKEQHGPFQRLSDLKKVKLVDDEIYRKLVHYLVVN